MACDAPAQRHQRRQHELRQVCTRCSGLQRVCHGGTKRARMRVLQLLYGRHEAVQRWLQLLCYALQPQRQRTRLTINAVQACDRF